MNRLLIICAASGAAVLMVVATGCEKLKARDNLNKGVQAYRSAKYSDAVEFFKSAVQMDPTFNTARLYLATAYMSQYIPGAESPENQQMAEAANREFLEVLRQNPNDKIAIQSLASLRYNQAQGIPSLDDKFKKLDEAKEWYQKLVTVDPNNEAGHYSLGVIVWLKWYPKYQSARIKLGMKSEEPGPIKDKKVREELKTTYSAMIEEGIKSLERALEINKEYDDAMAYMNLLIRERADLADSPDQYKKDIDTADAWVQKTLDTKKIKAARTASAGGIIQETK